MSHINTRTHPQVHTCACESWRMQRAQSRSSRDIQREADTYRQRSRCVLNYLKYSNNIIRYLLYKKDPRAAIVEMILKGLIPKFISQAAAGYQNIQEDLRKIIYTCITRHGVISISACISYWKRVNKRGDAAPSQCIQRGNVVFCHLISWVSIERPINSDLTRQLVLFLKWWHSSQLNSRWLIN